MSMHSRHIPNLVQQLTTWTPGLLALSFAVLGCTSCGDNTPMSSAPTATSSAPPAAQTSSSTPAQDTSTYTFAQKEEFETTMKANLDRINAEIADLSARIDKANDQAKADAKPKLQALRDQAAKLGAMLGKAQVATSSSWDAVKADFKTGFADLEVGVTDARKWLSEKIAP